MKIDDTMFKYMSNNIDTSKLIGFFGGIGPAAKLEFKKSLIDQERIMVSNIESAISVPLTLEFINNLVVEK